MTGYNLFSITHHVYTLIHTHEYCLVFEHLQCSWWPPTHHHPSTPISLQFELHHTHNFCQFVPLSSLAQYRAWIDGILLYLPHETWQCDEENFPNQQSSHFIPQFCPAQCSNPPTAPPLLLVLPHSLITSITTSTRFTHFTFLSLKIFSLLKIFPWRGGVLGEDPVCHLFNTDSLATAPSSTHPSYLYISPYTSFLLQYWPLRTTGFPRFPRGLHHLGALPHTSPQILHINPSHWTIH